MKSKITDQNQKSNSSEREYMFYWLTGVKEILVGSTPAEAINRAGYGGGILKILDFYEIVDNSEDVYKWSKENRTWELTKHQKKLS